MISGKISVILEKKKKKTIRKEQRERKKAFKDTIILVTSKGADVVQKGTLLFIPNDFLTRRTFRYGKG